jgi:hypothetical protein
MKIPPSTHAAPTAIREYLVRCDADEEFVTWWQVERPRDPHEALWVITCRRSSQAFTVSRFPTVVPHWSHQIYGSTYDVRLMEEQLAAGLWQAPMMSRAAVTSFLRGLEAS